jgi:hypothetical protein
MGAVRQDECVPSVYQQVLGQSFGDLDPALQAYFGEIPPGSAGHGSGVYEVAGSRHRWLVPVLAWLARRQVLFPEYGRDIPFDIVNTPTPGGLSARRTFSFPGRTRVMVDAISVIGGRLHDRLGRRGGLEVEFALGVVDGGLQMVSGRQWLHLGARRVRLRLRMPGLVRVRLSERAVTGSAIAGGRQRVDVLMTTPVLGEVFRYAGEFSYQIARTRG